VSPGLHAAISEALNRFATGIVPEIAESHRGVVIYRAAMTYWPHCP
jgi:hypothetical protein